MTRRDPLILDLDETPLPEAPAPADAPPVEDRPTAAERVLSARGRRPSGLARMAWASLLGLVALWAGLAFHDYVAGLIAERPWAGWLALGLAAVLGLGLIALILAELAALARLKRAGRLRRSARAVLESGSADALAATLAGLDRLYAARPEMAAARVRIAEARGDTPDAPAMLAIAEREMLAGLDRAAEARAAAAARTVAATTALIPMAALDMLAVLAANLRMIREVAEIYEGRAGWLGSWRLLRAVAAHLVATGAVAATDDLLGPLVGGGVLGKVSRRFGEAAVNAALTARVGAAAIEVCRPLPFHARPAPRARNIVVAALKGWRGSPQADSGST
jgi:putative membrane protein